MFIFWQKFLNQLKDKGNIPLLIWVLRMGNSTIAYLYFDTDFIIADWLLTDSARTTVAWTKFGLLIFSSVFFQTTGPIPTKLETTGETLPVWPPKRKEDLEGKLIFRIIIRICLGFDFKSYIQIVSLNLTADPLKLDFMCEVIFKWSISLL